MSEHIASPRAVLIRGADGKDRCAWAAHDELYRRYHDDEWGLPLHGDRDLFENLSLEAFQSGLSWITILRRRERFRSAFDNFSIDSVAAFGDSEVEALMSDPGVIRHRAKIVATIGNARVTQQLLENDDGALDRLLWSFAPTVRRPRPTGWDSVPGLTVESAALSAALRVLGYRFVGPTTMYALMQATGIVDDHFVGCWRTFRSG